MFGAFLGDSIGSIYEHNNIKSKDFILLSPRNYLTDDSYLTMAVMQTLLDNKDDLKNIEKIKKDCIINFLNYYHEYPYAGYGSSFYYWCYRPSHSPYNSFGNGAGMRISPVAWVSKDIEQVKELSKAITEVTHNHEEGIKGAECIAVCVYHLLHGKDKEFIKDLVINEYYPRLKDLDYDELVKNYTFDVTCQGSVAEAIYCFLISKDFEDCARTAVSIGGDSDTIAAMACSLGEAYYRPLNNELIEKVKVLMDDNNIELVKQFDEFINY